MKIINKVIHSWINVTLIMDKIYIYTTKYIKYSTTYKCYRNLVKKEYL